MIQYYLDLAIPYVNIIVKAIAYGLVLYAIWLITEELRSHLQKRFQYRIGRIRLNPVKISMDRRLNRLEQHIFSLLQATLERPTTKDSVKTYKRVTNTITVALAVAVALSARSIPLTLLVGGLGWITPYLFLQYRLHLVRLARANQFDVLVKKLLSNYRIQQNNIYFALRDTASQLHQMKSPLASPTMKLVSTIQTSFTSDEEIFQALRSYVFATKTVLAQQLGALLATAIINKLPIDAQLQQLDGEITEIQKTLKDEKHERWENIILGYVPLLIMPVSVTLLYYYTGTKYLSLQFSNKGTYFFILSIVAVVVSIVIGIFSRQPKLDV